MPLEPQIVQVRRTYLQLSQPGDLKPAGMTGELLRIERAVECPASFFRYLYAEVGRSYHWVDRLAWTDAQIQAHLARDVISLWVMYHSGAPAGYFELERHGDGSVEIAYFGLLAQFIGRGLGKRLLTAAANQAWASLPNRVWLHTCTLDDPAALPNYLKRGFRPFKEETYSTIIEPGETLRSASLNPQEISPSDQ